MHPTSTQIQNVNKKIKNQTVMFILQTKKKAIRIHPAVSLLVIMGQDNNHTVLALSCDDHVYPRQLQN
jgi:hypothetical protein